MSNKKLFHNTYGYANECKDEKNKWQLQTMLVSCTTQKLQLYTTLKLQEAEINKLKYSRT